MVEYDQEFTAQTFAEFEQSAQPLIQAYKSTFGGDPVTIAEAKAALDAHCRAWYSVSSRTNTARRKALTDDMILRECYGG